MAMGFYDLWKNVPYFKQFVVHMFRPAAAVFEWLEAHTQVRAGLLLMSCSCAVVGCGVAWPQHCGVARQVSPCSNRAQGPAHCYCARSGNAVFL